MCAQVERVRLFLDDLLRYGKPRPLDPLRFNVAPLIELTVANVRQAFGADVPTIEIEMTGTMQANADRSAFSDEGDRQPDEDVHEAGGPSHSWHATRGSRAPST
jgi:hypothetical protein